MEKVFEDYFTELQADMVDICLEYVANKAEEIYIYVSREGKMTMGNVFYKINNMFVRKHRLNDALTDDEKKRFHYDVSDARQIDVLTIIDDDIDKIINSFKGDLISTAKDLILNNNYNYNNRLFVSFILYNPTCDAAYEFA
jgi:hypothetical protein